MTKAFKRSFHYHGAKYSYLSWLIPELDKAPREHFIDVFGGSAVVLLNMPKSRIETYNDKNEKVYNLFRVLREHPDQLISLLELTPHSRTEYLNCWETDGDSNIERARKFLVRTQQSFGAGGAQTKNHGWSRAINESRCNISQKTLLWLSGIDNLKNIVERFKTVQIENQDFRKIISDFDSSDTLFYLDSPYDHALRGNTKYEFDFKGQDFNDMQYYAKNAKGKIAISGYNTAGMSYLFSGFNLHVGPHRKNNKSSKVVHECLWTNY